MNIPLKRIEQHPCDRVGCTSNATNHYHCGRCTSAQVTSMLGHYQWGEYVCKPEDLPAETRGNDIQVGTVVDTVDELEALPDETVIVGRGDKYDNEYSDTDWVPWQKDSFSLWRTWTYVDGYSSRALVTVKFLPIRYTVVWMPPTEEKR